MFFSRVKKLCSNKAVEHSLIVMIAYSCCFVILNSHEEYSNKKPYC